MLASTVTQKPGWLKLEVRIDTHIYTRITRDGVAVIRTRWLAKDKWKIFDPLITGLNFAGVMEVPQDTNPFDYAEQIIG